VFALGSDEFIDQACCTVEADAMSLATGSQGKSRGDVSMTSLLVFTRIDPESVQSQGVTSSAGCEVRRKSMTYPLLYCSITIGK